MCYSKLWHLTMQIISYFISSGCSCCMLWSHTWLPSKIYFKKTWRVFVFTTTHTVLFQKLTFHWLLKHSLWSVCWGLFHFFSKFTNACAFLQKQDGCSFLITCWVAKTTNMKKSHQYNHDRRHWEREDW